MKQSDLLDYLRSQRYGVLGSLSPALEPQGALVGYAVTPAFEILFDTIRSSRKYINLLAHPRVSFRVAGLSMVDGVPGADERTVQYEGAAEELSGEALQRLRPIYFAAWPECIEHQQWEGITWFVIRPLWARYSDYNVPVIQEWTF